MIHCSNALHVVEGTGSCYAYHSLPEALHDDDEGEEEEEQEQEDPATVQGVLTAREGPKASPVDGGVSPIFLTRGTRRGRLSSYSSADYQLWRGVKCGLSRSACA
jgi:hypothetical protein